MLTKLDLARWQQASGWCVALSGGLDSSVLLHLLHSYLQQNPGPRLRAVHIQHGLQQAAQDWPEHCRQFCQQLGVELQVLEVQVAAGASLEQAARDARYQAFRQNLGTNEVLMLGQHADDQAETLLLRLLRGAGVCGLQAMPLQRQLGHGSLLRPLLGISRQHLLEYAIAHDLHWIEDPTNQQDDFDRNYLRNQVMPLLKQRWPSVLSVFGRTCQQMRSSNELLADLARLDLQPALAKSEPSWLTIPVLHLEPLLCLRRDRQINALRFWLADKTLLPDERHWAGWDDLCRAGADAQPQWQLHGGVLLRSAGLLYWLAQDWLQQPPPVSGLLAEGKQQLPGNGSLLLIGTKGQKLHLRYRQGGEQIRMAKRGRRDLKRLLQELRLPWFVRARLPLLFDGDQLVAVANYPQLNASGWEDLDCRWDPEL